MDKKSLDVVLMGPPAAGKGTHSKFIETTFQIPHISTGDIFRDAIVEQTPMGVKAKAFLDSGELVPDEITVGIVRERLLKPDTEKGFLLDGFPRTLAQAQALDEMLSAQGRQLTAVVNIVCAEKVLVDRIVTRRVCPNCGASFNVVTLKPKVEGVCDYCGHALMQRKDDTAEAFKTRLAEFTHKTAPLVAYYQAKGILSTVDTTNGDVEAGNRLIGAYLTQAVAA